jgi:hypothetical protein
MPHRSSNHGHHSHGHSGSKKHALKASSMATRHKSGGDSKKLLTKTYSEIGVANNSQAETPTPSEKVSKWHRDILLVSPPSAQHPHPRHCICDQCMAEYGTYRIYNQLLDSNPNSSIIKIDEEIQKQAQNNENEQQQQQQSLPQPLQSSKNDKVRQFLEIQKNLDLVQ